MPIKIASLLIVVLLAAASCNKIKVPENRLPDSLDSATFINKWLISDQFEFDSSLVADQRYQDTNFLSAIGLNEDSISGYMYDKLPGFFSRSKITIKADSVPFPLIKFLKKQEEKKRAVKYLFSTLVSSSDTLVMLLVNSSQTLKIWLNGSLVYRGSSKRNQQKFYEEYIPVNLKSGLNHLQVKVGVHDLSSYLTHWHFGAYVSSIGYARDYYIKDYASDFIHKPILDSGDMLHIYLGPFALDSMVQYQLKDGDDKIVSSGFINNWKTVANTGSAAFSLEGKQKNTFYTLKITTSRGSLEEDFFYGNFAEYYQGMKRETQRVSQLISDAQTRINMNASMNRLTYVTGFHMNGELHDVRFWDRNRVFFAKELNDFLKQFRSSNGRNLMYDWFLNGFVSKLDSSLQFYGVHIYHSWRMGTRKLPLLIIMPFPSAGDIPLESSWAISNLDEMTATWHLADKFGFAVMWVDLRGQPGTNAIGTYDLMESISAVKRHYPIDTDRIFLLGNSASATTALLNATRLPDIVAGCALVNPYIGSNYISEQLNPVNLLQNLYKSHVFIKGAINDEMVPIDMVRKFYSNHYGNFGSSQLKVANEGTHFVAPKDYYYDVFSFFSTRKMLRNKGKILFSSYSDTYAQKFWGDFRMVSADVRADVDVCFNNDSLFLKTRNVKCLSLNASAIPTIQCLSHIIINGRKVNSPTLTEGKYTFNISDSMVSYRPKIDEVFGRPFLVVYGDSSKTFADSLAKHWKKKYYSDWRMKADKQVSEEDLLTYNLVVVGNENNNSLISRLRKYYPLSVKANEIKVGTDIFKGENLLCYHTFKSPFGKNIVGLWVVTEKVNSVLPVIDLPNISSDDHLVFECLDGGYTLMKN